MREERRGLVRVLAQDQAHGAAQRTAKLRRLAASRGCGTAGWRLVSAVVIAGAANKGDGACGRARGRGDLQCAAAADAACGVTVPERGCGHAIPPFAGE